MSFLLAHSETSIVYPPCDTSEHRRLGVGVMRQRCILSIGQFRPEKDHVKQLYILRKLIDAGESVCRQSRTDDQFADVRLVLVGGCRNEEDEKRVAELKRIVSDLGLERNVVFEVNVAFYGWCNVGAVRTDAGVLGDESGGHPHDVERAFRHLCSGDDRRRRREVRDRLRDW